MSERRAGQVTGQARATQRYVPRPSPDEPALIARSVALATRFGRYGYRRIPARLRQAGWRVNHKRVERRWRQEGLRVPRKAPHRRRLWATGGSCTRRRAERPNHVWSYDCVHERDAGRAAPVPPGLRGYVSNSLYGARTRFSADS